MDVEQVRRDIVGKKIARFVASEFATTAGGEPAYDPQIVLGDGTIIRFCIQETEVGEYGVMLNVLPPTIGKAKGRSKR